MCNCSQLGLIKLTCLKTIFHFVQGPFTRHVAEHTVRSFSMFLRHGKTAKGNSKLYDIMARGPDFAKRSPVLYTTRELTRDLSASTVPIGAISEESKLVN